MTVLCLASLFVPQDNLYLYTSFSSKSIIRPYFELLVREVSKSIFSAIFINVALQYCLNIGQSVTVPSIQESLFIHLHNQRQTSDPLSPFYMAILLIIILEISKLEFFFSQLVVKAQLRIKSAQS